MRTFGWAVLAITVAFAIAPGGVLPASLRRVARAAEPSPLETSIEGQPICVGSFDASAGTLADTLYYRAVQTRDGKLVVGYFVFYSEERPWGNNWMTWTVLPALAVDMVYSRSLLIGPGIQRALYGKGDVEGFRVTYDVGPDGHLGVESAVADDGAHALVALDRADVLSVDPGTPTFYSDVWSHQLGGRGARSKNDLATLTCFDRDHVRPLPDEVERDFNVDRRAPPAHVERLADVARAVGWPPS